MDFAKYLRKLVVSKNSKVYYGRFLRNGLYDFLLLFFHSIQFINVISQVSYILNLKLLNSYLLQKKCPY